MPSKSSNKMESPISQWFKKNFLTGIVIIFPVFITFYLLYKVFQFIDGFTANFINNFLRSHWGVVIPGIGLLLTVIFILLVGFAYNYFLGRKFFPLFEGLLIRIPIIANIYPSAKELSQFLFGSSAKNKFQKVVSVEFPQPGTYSIGFITNEGVDELRMNADDAAHIAVFIPLAPTPVTGHIILVSRHKVRELDITVDRAIKFIVSGGVVL